MTPNHLTNRWSEPLTGENIWEMEAKRLKFGAGSALVGGRSAFSR